MKKISIIDRLQAVIDNEHGTISFHFEDGSTQHQPINPVFFQDEKGKQLDLNKVAIKINDIAHDLGAKYYIVE